MVVSLWDILDSGYQNGWAGAPGWPRAHGRDAECRWGELLQCFSIILAITDQRGGHGHWTCAKGERQVSKWNSNSQVLMLAMKYCLSNKTARILVYWKIRYTFSHKYENQNELYWQWLTQYLRYQSLLTSVHFLGSVGGRQSHGARTLERTSSF